MKGAPRKLRKSCSLPTCSKTPGECMHCTCDGRCGQHDPGRCGVHREGNGKSCKRDGCAKDATCLHSTRATCCHCRNLVSSSNRSSRKRTRADVEGSATSSVVAVSVPVAVATASTAATVAASFLDEEEDDDDNDDDVPDDELLQDIAAIKTEEPTKTTSGAVAVATDVDGASSPTSCDALLPLSADIFGDFDIGDDLLVVIKKPRTEAMAPAVATSTSSSLVTKIPFQQTTTTTPVAMVEDKFKLVPSTVSTKSLSEYEQYASRRHASNLVVVVEGTQFNLHKHPMLLESQLLNAKARESLLTSQSPIPVVQLSSFPGGAATFEALCVYAYTGELHFTADTTAALYSAVHYMNMGLAATTQARHFLTTITHQAGLVDTLLRVTQDASVLMDKHDSLSICAELHLECVDALARVLPLQLASVQKLLAFPIELYLQVTQEMLATRGPQELAVDMVRQLCVQAELAQIHRDGTEKKDATAPQRCLALLEQSLASSSTTSSAAMHGGLKGGSATGSSTTQEDEDDALFMKMMYDFEMDPASDDEGSSGAFADALSVAALEPLAFASRGVGNHRGAFTAAAFAV